MQLGQLFRHVAHRVRRHDFRGGLQDAVYGILVVDVTGD